LATGELRRRGGSRKRHYRFQRNKVGIYSGTGFAKSEYDPNRSAHRADCHLDGSVILSPIALKVGGTVMSSAEIFCREMRCRCQYSATQFTISNCVRKGWTNGALRPIAFAQLVAKATTRSSSAVGRSSARFRFFVCSKSGPSAIRNTKTSASAVKQEIRAGRFASESSRR